MQNKQHNTVVTDQFSPTAHSYLTSIVHARGPDLEQMAVLVGERPQADLIDVGCGGGHVAFTLATLVKSVVAYDLSDAMLSVVADEANRRGLHNLTTKLGAAENLPCPTASYDIAVTRYSAHHWQDVPTALAQMRRVVKPGGMGIFMDVMSPGLPLLDTWLQSLELLRDPSHVRNASLAEWQAYLAQAGFAISTSTKFRLRLDFPSWIARMKTPDLHVQAIRALQQRAGAEVSDYFEFEADGSFTVDTMLISALVAVE